MCCNVINLVALCHVNAVCCVCHLSACLQTFFKINGSVLSLSCCYCTTWWTESTGKQQVATWLHYWLFDPENKIMAQRLLVSRQPLCRAPNEANTERHQRLPVQKSIVKVHFELLAHLWWLMTHCLGWLWAGISQRNPQWRSQCPRTPFHQPKTQTTVPVFGVIPLKLKSSQGYPL